MHKFEFTSDDLFINRLKAYPEYNIFIYQSRMYVNKETQPNGSGGIVVYDINSNKSTGKILPFVVTGSDKVAFKSQKFQPLVQSYSGDHFTISKYATEEGSAVVDSYYGESRVDLNGETVLTSSYGSESPIKRKLTTRQSTFTTNFYNITSSTTESITQNYLSPLYVSASALQNVARKYTTMSDHFIFASSSARSRDLIYGSDDINFINIPSMYYGSTIKKGSVELNYYITGSKIASCADTSHNGILIGTTGSTLGSVVGLVMYDEGIIMLTSSVNIETGPPLGIQYDGASPILSSWQYYGTTLNDGIPIVKASLASASYDLNFKGTNYITSMTMFAHAKKGQLNHSNNPTYRNLNTTRVNQTGSGLIFSEGPSDIANIVSGSFVSSSFEKTTYISKVHIYDEDGNLIGITSLANPIKKTLQDEFTFKMKLDL